MRQRRADSKRSCLSFCINENDLATFTTLSNAYQSRSFVLQAMVKAFNDGRITIKNDILVNLEDVHEH